MKVKEIKLDNFNNILPKIFKKYSLITIGFISICDGFFCLFNFFMAIKKPVKKQNKKQKKILYIFIGTLSIFNYPICLLFCIVYGI